MQLGCLQTVMMIGFFQMTHPPPPTLPVPWGISFFLFLRYEHICYSQSVVQFNKWCRESQRKVHILCICPYIICLLFKFCHFICLIKWAEKLWVDLFYLFPESHQRQLYNKNKKTNTFQNSCSQQIGYHLIRIQDFVSYKQLQSPPLVIRNNAFLW